MPLAALALALAAAAIHAAWNMLLAGRADTHAASAVAVAAGVVMFAPVAAVTWRLAPAAVPYMVASALLEALYLGLLATAYARSEMGLAYPIARGSAPVLVLLVSVVALGAQPSPVAAAGVLVVASGIVLVRGVREGGGARELGLAVAVGACIAGYTLIDKQGMAHAAPVPYLELVLGGVAPVYLGAVWRVRGGAAVRAAVGAQTILAGAGVFGSYALVLAALGLAPAATVAAVRECSVVIAAVALTVSGRERGGAPRLAGAVLVTAGIALVSLG